MENISGLKGSLQHPAGTDEVVYVVHGDHFENKFQYFQGKDEKWRALRYSNCGENCSLTGLFNDI